MTTPDTPAQVRRARRRRVEALAERQSGVVSRRQLYDRGISRGEVRANVRAGRWRRVGTQSICVHRGPLPPEAWQWAALFEAGPRAHLDGASSLVAGGLRGFSVERIRVSVPRGARIRLRRRGRFDVRETRRYDPADVVLQPLPRTRDAVAAVRGALWARTNKEAALLVTMTVQQGRASAAEIGEALLAVRRDKRRRFLHDVVLDLLDGARSLGELDFARECRRRGLPEPTRQVVRKGHDGRYYLDVYWGPYGVVVEIDGIHHAWAENVVGDAVRHNEVALSRDIVLRLPLLGLRVQPETFFTQIRRALESGGWSPAPLSAA